MVGGAQKAFFEQFVGGLFVGVDISLLVGVTTFISTDVAAIPLLWVVPLSMYLLTFVIVFASTPLIPQSWMIRAEPHVHDDGIRLASHGGNATLRLRPGLVKAAACRP